MSLLVFNSLSVLLIPAVGSNLSCYWQFNGRCCTYLTSRWRCVYACMLDSTLFL